MGHVEGGFFLVARKFFASSMMDKPPLHTKLWFWMLERAMWKDGDKLKRGQFVTSTPEMQEAMSYRVGWRKETPTKDEIRSAYEAFVKATMITTAKTTSGMVITILNYDLYQNPASYEAHSERHDEDTTKPTATPHHREEGEERGKKEKKKTPAPLPPKGERDQLFDEFWQAYPKKVGKDAARKAWGKRKVDPHLLAAMLQAIEQQERTDQWTKDNGQYIPNPATWLNQGRWEDEVDTSAGTSSNSPFGPVKYVNPLFFGAI